MKNFRGMESERPVLCPWEMRRSEGAGCALTLLLFLYDIVYIRAAIRLLEVYLFNPL